MKNDKRKLLIIQVAALGYDLLKENNALELNGITFKPMDTVFPALTCPAQASFRTGAEPNQHGIVGNGFLFKDLNKPLFWEQSSSLVKGERIWSTFREAGNSVGMLFWQQSLGEKVDCLLSPAPIHKHHGGMIQDCYSIPESLYHKLGNNFNLMHYWGPLASAKSSDWISNASLEIMKDPKLSPDLLMTYLPLLDYDLQRYGPDSIKAQRALSTLITELKRLLMTATENGYDAIVFGDYAIEAVDGAAIKPNKALLDAELFVGRNVNGRIYPDFNRSEAFAVVDHAIAHIYGSEDKAKNIIQDLDGVEKVLTKDDQKALGIDHDRSGDLIAVAKQGRWFAYPWWNNDSEAPDWANHVDIHNKPGYDPCELFFGWPPMSVSRDTSKIKGTHGRDGVPAAWASTCSFDSEPATLLELSSQTKKWLESNK